MGAAQQGFAVSLSADGNTAVVGGYGDNSATGAAWVWTRIAGVWNQQGTKLVGTGAVGAADQGFSVSLSADGNTAVIGGYADNTNVGAAWVCTRSGSVWSQQGLKLVGTGAVGAANQGYSVALSADGNTAIVGGYADSSLAGAAWVCTRSAGVWSQQGAKLVGTGAVGAAYQGISVALSADGNTAIVGGFADNGSAGAAWVFTRSGGVWSQQGTKLVGTGAVGAAQQGYSVALSADGNTAVVGGYADNGITGAAWVWTRSGGVWSQQGTKLVGTGAVGAAQQGLSVSLSADGNTAIVGGSDDNSSLGAVWVFTRSGGVWSQQGTKLVGTGAVGAADEGASVSVSSDGKTAFVGAPGDNSFSGATWVFAAPAPNIVSIRDVPNDQGRQVRLSFTSSAMDCLGSVTPITGYYIYRRAAIAMAVPQWAGVHVQAAGAAKPEQAQLDGWDYVSTVPATTDSIYQTVVPTLADSNSTGFHRAALLMRAATSTPGIYFESSPDSGYSADNLPPVAPAPFTAAYASGATHLHWGPNSEPDLWYYRVYRGSSSGFSPGASNLIASRPDTGYADLGAAGSYYKLSAVDINGNESSFTLLTPAGTLGVAHGSPEFALELLRNPSSDGRCSVSISLPSAARATLELVDVSGRRMAMHEVGVFGAGWYSVDLGAERRLSAGNYFLRR